MTIHDEIYQDRAAVDAAVEKMLQDSLTNQDVIEAANAKLANSRENLNKTEPCWTTTPTLTGAYWYKYRGLSVDVVWVYNDRVFSVIESTLATTVKDHTQNGGMFYGPFDQPPEIPQVTSISEADALEALRQEIDTYQSLVNKD